MKFLAGQKILTPDLDKHKSTPLQNFRLAEKNFGQKIPTPDLDNVKVSPPMTEVTPDLDTTHPGGQFCQRKLPCVFITSGSKWLPKVQKAQN